MAKFCGNCGAQMDDGAKVCGNCGTPMGVAPGTGGNIPGIKIVDPEKRAKNKKIAKLVVAGVAAAAVVAIAVSIISGFVGYKGAVRKFMKAYEDYDVDTIIDMASGYYDEYNEENLENLFGNPISADLDYFEEKVGHKYKLSYEIKDAHELSKHKRESLMEDLESRNADFDVDSIDKVMEVKIKVIAKEGKDKRDIELKLTLTKEDGDWKVLYANHER